MAGSSCVYMRSLVKLSLLFWRNSKLWVRSSQESQVCTVLMSRCFMCFQFCGQMHLDDLILKSFVQIFFTTPLFPNYCWKWPVFFLGRQPSSLTVVHFPEQSGILHRSSPQKEINSHHIQPCLKIFLLKEVSGACEGLNSSRGWRTLQWITNKSRKTCPYDLCYILGVKKKGTGPS